MRLRSSQFVFLMLLVCSVRIQDQCATQLTAAIAGPIRLAASSRENSSARSERTSSLDSQPISTPTSGLGPAARAAHRVTWSMPSPAAASAAIVSHTSLLRA